MASPVRNIGSPSSSRLPKPIPIYHVVPPSSDAAFNIKIETSTETIDLEDLVIKGQWSDGVTNVIGGFEFNIIDPDKTIYDKVSKFDEVVIYADYGEAVTERFRGKIERKGYQDIYLVISGRSIGMIYADFPIIYNSGGLKKRSDILKEIIEENFTDIDTSGIEEDTSEVNVNYFEIPFTEIIEEICGESFDFYLRYDYVAQYFERGSRQNQLEAISELANHVETTDNADDTEEVYTKIRAYGAEIKDIPLIYTTDSDTSSTQGVEKVLKYDNKSNVTSDELSDLADSEFEKVKNSKRIATHNSLLLPSLQPGEKLFIIIPREDVPPAYYEIRNFTHTIDINAEYSAITTVNVKRQRLNTAKIIKGRVSFENRISTNVNPNNLDFSKIWDFSTSEGTFSNTQRVFISDGSTGYYVLKTISGDSGTWTSPNINFSPNNLSAIEFRINGDNLAGTPPEGTKVEYSFDGGITFQTWGAQDVAVESKGQLQVRVSFSSSETTVKAVGALYSL